MSVIRAAVGDNLKEFDEDATFQEVWAFINSHMVDAANERAIVLMDDGGQTLGQIWDSSLYYAHWETPAKMRAYLDLFGFDQDQ